MKPFYGRQLPFYREAKGIDNMSESKENKNGIKLDVVNKDNCYYVEIPAAIALEMGMIPDADTLTTNIQNNDNSFFWDRNEDSTWTLKRETPRQTETQWVLVETINMVKNVYMVETPINKSDWALDSVVMQEVPFFIQYNLGETIVSDRVTSPAEAVQMFRKEHPEYEHTDDATIMHENFTFLEDLEKKDTHH